MLMRNFFGWLASGFHGLAQGRLHIISPMKDRLLFFSAFVLAGVITAQAVPLTPGSSITFSTDDMVANNVWTGSGGDGTVNQINTITSFGVVTVDSRTGSFVPTVSTGMTVTLGTPLAFAAPFANNPLWSVGGFTFNLTSFNAPVRTDNLAPVPDSLALSGMGTIQGAGFDVTPGGWTWTGTMDGSSSFSFASTTVAGSVGVPDSGSTLALLGVALASFIVLRRRMSR
jgi:hypothetical protein